MGFTQGSLYADAFRRLRALTQDDKDFAMLVEGVASMLAFRVCVNPAGQLSKYPARHQEKECQYVVSRGEAGVPKAVLQRFS